MFLFCIKVQLFPSPQFHLLEALAPPTLPDSSHSRSHSLLCLFQGPDVLNVRRFHREKIAVTQKSRNCRRLGLMYQSVVRPFSTLTFKRLKIEMIVVMCEPHDSSRAG